MKKILTLVMALMLAVTANSYAEETNYKGGQERSNLKQENRSERGEMRKERGDKMRKMRKEARDQCSSKCGVDKEKVMKCRKEKGFNKENRGDGSCVSEKAKVCMRECMQSKKSAMREHNRKSYTNDSAKQRKNMDKDGKKSKNGKSKTEKEDSE